MNPQFGRRPPVGRPALRLAPLLTGLVPVHPSTQDNLDTLAPWQVLGNDVAGDCVAVTWANFRRLVTSFLSTEHYPTQDQVWALYKTQNPDFDPNGSASTNGPGSIADQGMDIQTVLEYLVKHGGPDGVKAVAFAKVDYTNLEEVKAAISIFGGVWTGINVLAANMDEFTNGAAWDYVPNSPIDGGHSILSGGYSGQPDGDVEFITWGRETAFTEAFWNHQVEEAWVVIWPEHLGTKEFQNGIDIGALATAYQEITGATFPVPAPAPVPVPPAPAPVPVPVPPVPAPPAPAPDPVPVVVPAFPLRAVAPWLDGTHRTKRDKRAATAIATWLDETPLPVAGARHRGATPGSGLGRRLFLAACVVIAVLIAIALLSPFLAHHPVKIALIGASTPSTVVVTSHSPQVTLSPIPLASPSPSFTPIPLASPGATLVPLRS